MHTRLSIKKIDIGLLNRIIIDDLKIDDHSGKEMLNITRLSAKFDILPLLKGKISIGTVQLFSFNAKLNKKDNKSAPNFQFIIDTFASKDSLKKNNDKLNLRINSLLIRRGRISYDVLSEKNTLGKFNTKHINLQNIIASISLKAMQKDSVNFYIRRLSMNEIQSGLSLKKLKLHIIANNKQMLIKNFTIDFSKSSLKLNTVYIHYKSLKSLQHLSNDVHFAFDTPVSTITPKDLSPLVPALYYFREPLLLKMSIEGSPNQLTCKKLAIKTDDNQFRLMGSISLQDLKHINDAYIYGKLSELSASSQGVQFLIRNLSKNYKGTPPILTKLGDISFNGEISGYLRELVMYGSMHTSCGQVRTDVKLSSNKEKHLFTYSGSIKTDNFDLGTLLSEKKIGKIAFNLDIQNIIKQNQTPSINMKGLISSIEYANYKYENITIDGTYNKNKYEGKINLDDSNGTVHIKGKADLTNKTPIFNFQAIVDNLRPNKLNLTKKYKDTEISCRAKADFTGGSIDQINGIISIDSLTYTSPGKSIFTRNIYLRSTSLVGKKHLDISSEFLTANIDGEFSFNSLSSSIHNMLSPYLPSIFHPLQQKNIPNNRLTFDVRLNNSDLLSVLFNIPLKVYTNSNLSGSIDDKLKKVHIEGYFPKFQYNNKSFESGTLICENSSKHLNIIARATNIEKKNAFNISLNAKAENNALETVLNFANNDSITYSGELVATTMFQYIKGNKPRLKTIINIKPTKSILNDSLWNINSSTIVIDSDKVNINNFYFSHRDRHIKINGCLSKNSKDTVKVNLKDINMNYLFDILQLTNDVHFGGDATGEASFTGALKQSDMQANLFIKNFTINSGLLGDLNITGRWDKSKRGIYLDGKIKDTDLYHSHVTGYIYPLKPESGLDLKIDAGGLNIQLIATYINSIATDLKGRATGNVHLYGHFNALNLVGDAMTDGSMKFESLNTVFAIKDTLHLSTEGISVQNARIYDADGHPGIMNGYLHYKNFKNMKYNFEINAKNMLVMNTVESPDNTFYGKVYGTGNATIYGSGPEGLNVTAALTTNTKTSFTYIDGSVASATSNQFINFVDKTPRYNETDSLQLSSLYEKLHQQQNKDEEQESDIHLNLLIDVTPDADMRIIMDPISGDYIKVNGNGNIRCEFYNKGEFKMFGNYRISNGVYKFSLKQVIRKDFDIKDGSTINFSGSPFDAIANIKSTYTVNSVVLSDLIPDASSIVQQTNVKVDCIMNLTGKLLNPTVNLDIELPNEKDEIQSLVRNYIGSTEEMDMQFLYLLSIGKFYTQENSATTANSNKMSSVLSSTLSGQLNNVLSQVINNNKWNVGTNLSTGENGWTDMEIEGILSGQLLNNRLLVNGNFGYRENPLANTNFVGDFEAELLLNHTGNIRLKAYNETNDRYYTKTNLVTQGVGVVYRKEYTKLKELLFWNRWKLRLFKKHSKEKTEKKEKYHAFKVHSAN